MNGREAYLALSFFHVLSGTVFSIISKYSLGVSRSEKLRPNCLEVSSFLCWLCRVALTFTTFHNIIMVEQKIWISQCQNYSVEPTANIITMNNARTEKLCSKLVGLSSPWSGWAQLVLTIQPFSVSWLASLIGAIAPMRSWAIYPFTWHVRVQIHCVKFQKWFFSKYSWLFLKLFLSYSQTFWMFFKTLLNSGRKLFFCAIFIEELYILGSPTLSSS